MSVEMVKCKLNGRWEIILPKHRAERPEWYTEKGWEKKRLEALHDDIRPGTVIYYIGAEEGDMCALCALWGAKVVMFEPNDKVWPNIKCIWEANSLEDVHVFCGFAGNKDNRDEFETRSIYSFDGEVIHDHGFKELHDSDDSIQSIKIDTFRDRSGLTPDIITMDVEGAEWEVLQGAEKTLRDYKPIIYLSLHPEFLFRIYDKYSYEVRRWIIDLGYEEELLEYEHEVHLVYRPKK